ncbi:hypothetical protein BJV82DRAFT_610670 [Fennellomyces sp. T-0311]|nr:hypothetical protein BJV82DRAFT_610670 [Fennellomyces sp. T-0311]
MKAAYIIALFAAFAVANAWTKDIDNSIYQQQAADQNNAQKSTADGDNVSAPAAVQGGVKAVNAENKNTYVNQGEVAIST